MAAAAAAAAAVAAAAAAAERGGAEPGGGEDHVDDIGHLHSCQLSVSFGFVSVGRANRLVHELLQLSKRTICLHNRHRYLAI